MPDEGELDSLVDRKLAHHREENEGNACGITSSQMSLYEELKRGMTSKDSSGISLSCKAAGILKEHEYIIVHGTKEDVVNQKLVNMIDGDRKLVLNIGPVTGRFEVALNRRLPYSRIINARFITSLKNDGQDTGTFHLQDQENAMEYIASTAAEERPDLLILYRIMFKLVSPVEMLLRLKELLAPNAQVLVVDKNPRNIVAMSKLLERGTWQTATGSTFDFQDKKIMTKQELVRVFTVCGYQAVSADYNIDTRLEKLYHQGLQQKNKSDLHLDKIVLKRVTKQELRELCSNFMFLNLLNVG